MGPSSCTGRCHRIKAASANNHQATWHSHTRKAGHKNNNSKATIANKKHPYHQSDLGRRRRRRRRSASGWLMTNRTHTRNDDDMRAEKTEQRGEHEQVDMGVQLMGGTSRMWGGQGKRRVGVGEAR